MTQVCSLPSSTADVDDMYNNKRLPKGIHIVGTDRYSVSKVGGMSKNKDGFDENNHKKISVNEGDGSAQQNTELSSEKKKQEASWGYIFIQHMSAGNFEKKLESLKIDGTFSELYGINRNRMARV